MGRRFSGIVAISVLSGASLLAGKPAPDVAVLVTFGQGPADALRSDGFVAPGYLADYANGLENILALIQSSGNFRFFTQDDTRKPALRSTCFDFGAQVVPFQSGQCVNVGQPMHAFPQGDVLIQNLRYGQSVRKLTRFAWDQDSFTRYRLGYGTDMDQNGVQDSPPVTVTCIAPSDTSKPCATWVLAPATNGTAALFRFPLTTSRSGNVTEGAPQFLGTYTMPFVQTITVKK